MVARAYLTEEDLRNYGTDLVDFSQRAAAHALTPQLEHMRQQNANLQQQLAREAKARLDMALDAAIPDWRIVNADARWLQWLQQVDQLNGVTRQELLNRATAAGDAGRIVRFFRDFLQAAGGQAQSRTAGDKPIYTRAQIAWFYNQHRRGAYKGREADWARQEQDLYAAQREGRVVGGLPPTGTK
jgi:hypothetical protein